MSNDELVQALTALTDGDFDEVVALARRSRATAVMPGAPVPPTPLPPANPTEPPPLTPPLPGPVPGPDPGPAPIPPTPAEPDPAPVPPPAEISRPTFAPGTPTTVTLTPPPLAGPDTSLGSAFAGERDYEVPTLDDVRAKIEGRSARAVGQSELDAMSTQGRDQADQAAARAKAADEALARIRASLGS